MSATSRVRRSRKLRLTLAVAAGLAFGLIAATGFGQSPPMGGGGDRAAGQPGPKLFVDPPMPDLLTKGIVVIKFRTENMQIGSAFGDAATAASPPVGHLHIGVDDNPWRWAHTTAAPLIINYLPAGSHQVRIELADGHHKVLARQVVKFEVPQRPTPPGDPKPPSPSIKFSDDGKLKRPTVDYRKWVQIGTPLALHEGEAKEFHSVYIAPEDFAHFEKTGQFRDGTVVVKEAIGVGATESAAGKGYFMGDFTGLQVSIKDSKRFANEPGNWAYFDFGSKYPLRAEASKKSVAACNKCHQDNARTDWVFSQHYPVLRDVAPRSK